MSIWDLDKTADNNTTIEGVATPLADMDPANVDNVIRAIAGMLKEWQEDIGAALTSGGSSNAYTLTTNGTLAALADGVMIGFVANHTNTGAATFAPDGLTAKAFRKRGDVALEANDILSGGHYIVTYDASANSGSGAWILHNPSGYLLTDMMHVRDEKSSSNGGSSSADTWHTRLFTSTVTNTIGGASRSGAQVTLPAGTYDVWGRAPAFSVDRHQARFRNTTDGTSDLVGSNAYSTGSSAQTDSIVQGRITIAASKTFELQHYIELAVANVGLGVSAVSGEVDIYSELFIRKVR